MAVTTTIHGIKNCDTCRKALKVFADKALPHSYHDFRVDGLSEQQLDRWLKVVSWDKLLNRRGTSWRALPDGVKEAIDAASAKKLMMENPTLIKRPVFETGNTVVVGFTKAEQETLGL
ncbi:arsenate reductase [Kiloniella laminariae]|uniref:Arsenate reductase n=1 Tax=Kiloniella laminariae TaxID=454162 RepID=A0ABT4LKU9_9PROT|nr:arsenate reductase [Kiloniella laminariae]MCZ4281734.1 arsenate reductase [Kiloniella laminariae]